MIIAAPSPQALVNELQLLDARLPLDGARVLELGCGKAEKTRNLAAAGRVAEVVALEVDQIQHARNLAGEIPPNVRFAQGGAESIPAEDGSFDLVMMFKSLHHVPICAMGQAMAEIHRVLKPGGLAWISEPVFGGEMNEIMRLFHDEKQVRQAAFGAVRQAVERGLFVLEEQLFFETSSRFASFDEFDQRMIRVTHSNHELDQALYAAVRAKFESHLGSDGAHFRNPNRVDLLRKP